MLFALFLAISASWAAPAPACAPVSRTPFPGHAPAQGEVREEWRLTGPAAAAAENPATEEDLAAMPSLSAFRAEVERVRFGGQRPDPWQIMTRQRALFAQHLGEEEAHSHDLVLKGGVGRVRAITCLEALLTDAHAALQRPSAAQWYSEFRSSIYISRDGTELRAQFASSRNGSGAAPLMGDFSAQVAALRAEGWRPLTDVHNHPFQFEAAAIDIGGSLIPSGSHRPGHVQGGDAFAWEILRKNIGLPEARITNGFDTNVIAAEDFLKF